jgi:putative FmdB family regulatory protein
MPIHEYECQACKFYTEVMQKITDAPLTRCPSCGKRTLKKLMSAPAFRLKGGGWYETDFKSEKENKRNLVGAEKEEPKADAKAQATDAKPPVPEAKDAKPADSKPADLKPVESKAAAPKTAAAGNAATSGRNRVSVSAKATRAAAARKPTRASRGKGARRRRR